MWRIHFDIWQNQYNIVKLENKIKLKKKKKKLRIPGPTQNLLGRVPGNPLGQAPWVMATAI